MGRKAPSCYQSNVDRPTGDGLVSWRAAAVVPNSHGGDSFWSLLSVTLCPVGGDLDVFLNMCFV